MALSRFNFKKSLNSFEIINQQNAFFKVIVNATLNQFDTGLYLAGISEFLDTTFC